MAYIMCLQLLISLALMITTLQVNNNGIISDAPFSNYVIKSLTLFSQVLLAVFWTDLDTSSGSGSGKVFYRVSSVTKQADIREADQRIHKAFPSAQQFKTKEVAVVTWERVASYSKNYGTDNSKVIRNHLKNRVSTFQCVIAVGEDQMFLIYLYKQLMHSTTGSSSKATNFNGLVGYRSADSAEFYQHDSSLKDNIVNIQDGTNCGVPGQWIFNIKGVVCKALDLPHGRVTYTESINNVSFQIGATATHVCDNGYYLKGSKVRKCERGASKKGIWNGAATTCNAITCSKSSLGNPQNGQYTLTPVPASNNVHLSIGTNAVYSCNKGFLLSGDSTRTCGSGSGTESEGVWSGKIPVCEAITCLPLENIPNGRITYSPKHSEGSNISFGTNATYSCEQGFVPDSKDTVRTCGVTEGNRTSGKWSKAAPTCQRILCSLLDIENGDVVYSKETTNNSIDFGSVANYSCKEGFFRDGDPIRTCGEGKGVNGSWSGEAPICQTITCSKSSLGNPQNGQYTLTPVPASNNVHLRIGTNAVYSCNKGFLLSGDSTRTCGSGSGTESEGVWSGKIPVCEAITCFPLENILNGRITYSPKHSGGSNISFGTNATYSCEQGFVPDSKDTVRTCGVTEGNRTSGNWSKAALTCQRIRCSLLDIENGDVVYSKETTNNLIDFGSVANYSCKEGFFRDGDPIRTCGEGKGVNGSWSGEAPICQTIICPALDKLANGAIAYSTNNELKYGTEANHSCDSGYSLTGVNVRTCGEKPEKRGIDGKWSSVAPLCEPITCPPLEAILNGNIAYFPEVSSGSRHGFNATANYSCEEGFFLDGVSVRTCGTGDGVNGKWSKEGSIAICKPITCSALEVPKQMHIKYSERESPFKYSTEAFHNCSAGCNRIGPYVRVCGYGVNRGWSEQEPTCECPPTVVVDNTTNRLFFREEMHQSITSEKSGNFTFKHHGYGYTIQKDSVSNGTLNITGQVSFETTVKFNSTHFAEEGIVQCDSVSAVVSFRKENDETLLNDLILTMEHHCSIQDYKELMFEIAVPDSNGTLIFKEYRVGNFSRLEDGSQVGSVFVPDSDFSKYVNPHFMIVRKVFPGMPETKYEYSLRVYYNRGKKYKRGEMGNLIFTMCPNQEPHRQVANENIGQAEIGGISGKEPIVRAASFGDGQNITTLTRSEVQNFDVFAETDEDITKKSIEEYRNHSEHLLRKLSSDYPPRVLYFIESISSDQNGRLQLTTHNLSPNQNFKIPLLSAAGSPNTEESDTCDFGMNPCENRGTCYTTNQEPDTPYCKCYKQGYTENQCKDEEEKATINYVYVLVVIMILAGLLIIPLIACVFWKGGHSGKVNLKPCLTVDALKGKYKLTDSQLSRLVEEEDCTRLSKYFDNVTVFSNALGLTPPERRDLRQTALLEEDTQAAMINCLKTWRRHDYTLEASYRALLDAVLSVGRSDVADSICSYLSTKEFESRPHEEPSHNEEVDSSNAAAEATPTPQDSCQPDDPESDSESTSSLVLITSNTTCYMRLLCNCSNCKLDSYVKDMTCCTESEKRSCLVIFIKSFDRQELGANEMPYLEFRRSTSDVATSLQTKFEILVKKAFDVLRKNPNMIFKNVSKYVCELLVPAQSRYYTDKAKTKKLTEARNYKEIEEILLVRYCSWFNFELIRDVIRKFCIGNRSIMEELSNYEKTYHEFVDCGFFKYVEDLSPRAVSEAKTSNHCEVVCKLMTQITEITLDQVRCIRQIMSQCMVPVPKYALTLKCLRALTFKSRTNCSQTASGFLLITFRAPTYVTTPMPKKDVSLDIDKIKAYNLLSITIGKDKRLKFDETLSLGKKDDKKEGTKSRSTSFPGSSKYVRLFCKCGSCNIDDFVKDFIKISCAGSGKRSHLVIFVKCFADQELSTNEISYSKFRKIVSQRAALLQTDFEELFEETFKTLESKVKLDFKDFSKFLSNLLVPTPPPYCTRQKIEKKFAEAKGYGDIKRILMSSSFCSWFHFELIRDIRKNYGFGGESADKKLCSYQKTYTRFVDHGLFKFVGDLSPNFVEADHEACEIVCNLKTQITEISLDHIRHIQIMVLGIISLPAEYALALKCLHVEDCLVITFRAPMCVVPVDKVLSPDKIKALKCYNFLSLTIGGKELMKSIETSPRSQPLARKKVSSPSLRGKKPQLQTKARSRFNSSHI